jgi:hypothetical protein
MGRDGRVRDGLRGWLTSITGSPEDDGLNQAAAWENGDKTADDRMLGVSGGIAACSQRPGCWYFFCRACNWAGREYSGPLSFGHWLAQLQGDRHFALHHRARTEIARRRGR